MKQHRQGNAGLTIQQLRQLSGIAFGYNSESVEWLEGYIERMRQAGEFQDAAARDTLTSVFGAFLGECIVQCYGGARTECDDVWCVAFNGSNAAFPFAEVAKQMDNGLTDGVGGFFRAIPAVFAGRVRPPAPPDLKPWWKFGEKYFLTDHVLGIVNTRSFAS